MLKLPIARKARVLPHPAAALLGCLSLFAALDCAAALPIQHWQAATGARVYFVESHDLPMLDVSVEFPAGSSRDSRAKLRASPI